MAALSEQVRAACWSKYMQDERTPHAPITKGDILAAVNALDTFFDANSGAINNAFPVASRNALTTAQKSLLVRLVIQARFG